MWGLGCDPFDTAAVRRLLDLKQRPPAKGLILIAATLEQLSTLIDLDALPAASRAAVLATWPSPHTWSLPCTERVPEILRGEHATLAARVTAHPVAAALCHAFGSPLVSTSANLAGDPPPRTQQDLDSRVLSGLAGLVAFDTGGLDGPTPIRDARSGDLLRR